jgi:prepilin-type N-terminal cleavage/methylation domain-containing protein
MSMSSLDNAQPRRPARRRGFTLVEILTVVLILGIASAIIAPQIGSRNDLKARAAARVLVSDLLYAQNLAIAQQKWMYVKFDAAGESYRLATAPGTAASTTPITNPVTKDPFVTQFGPAGGSRMSDVRIQSAVFNGVDTLYQNDFTLAFDELGTPYVYCYDQANTNEMLNGTVVLQCGSHAVTVTVERYTGEIGVSE